MDKIMDLKDVSNMFGYTINIIVFILGGIAYRKLLGTYLGFIPFVGDFIGKYYIAEEYNSDYGRKFFFLKIFKFIFVPVYVFLIGMMALYYLVDYRHTSIPFMVAVGIFVVVLFGIAVLDIYYTYKILYPVVQDYSETELVGLLTFFFAFFAIAFYIWVMLIDMDSQNEEEY